MSVAGRGGLSMAVRVAGLAVGLLALTATFRTVDPLRAARLASAAAPLLPLLPVPYLASAGFDAAAWWLILLRLGRLTRFLPLLAVRLSADAPQLGLPAGSLVADGLSPYLLQARCHVPVTAGVASLAARRCLMVTAQAVYLALAACLASFAQPWNVRSSGLPPVPTALLGSAVGLLLVAGGLARLLGGGDSLLRVHGWLAALPGGIGRRVSGRLEGFREVDAHLVRVLGRNAAPLGLAVSLLVLAWLAESLESFLALGLIGERMGFAQLMPLEAAVSLVRVSAFLVPGGLGFQEAAYVGLLGAAGVPDPLHVGAALAAVKRLREAVFVALGSALLAHRPTLAAS